MRVVCQSQQCIDRKALTSRSTAHLSQHLTTTEHDLHGNIMLMSGKPLHCCFQFMLNLLNVLANWQGGTHNSFVM